MFVPKRMCEGTRKVYAPLREQIIKELTIMQTCKFACLQVLITCLPVYTDVKSAVNILFPKREIELTLLFGCVQWLGRQ